MTLPGKTYSLEGELVRDWVEYEFDVLEIEGQDVAEFVIDHLGPGRKEDVGTDIATDYHTKTYFGRVKLTIEVIG